MGSDRRLERASWPRPTRGRGRAPPPSCQISALFPPCSGFVAIALSVHNGLETGIPAVNGAPVAVGLHILLDQAPDAVFDAVKARLAFHGQAARALDCHRNDVLDLPRPAG